MLETDSSKGTRYTYQTKILAAACVDAGVDPAGTVQRKVQQFWQDSGPKLVCSRLDFSLQNGHVLKLAVERNSRDFINDVVRKWKLNLNIIDGADQRTVLDYISAQLDLARARGSALEPILRRYFDLFRTHGAKHAKEL